MSGETADRAMSDALHLQACDWIERRDFGIWSDADTTQFEAWLGESSAHRIAFLRAEHSWKSTEMLSVLRPFRSEQDAGSSRGGMRGSLRRFAAPFLVLAILGMAGAAYFETPHYKTYATAVGGHRTIALADGSRIELNTDTVVRIAQNAGQRKVVLENGEAYFEVKHDAAHPFVVSAGSHHVTDLGTKFVMRKHDDNLEVALVEGRVRFDDTGNDGKARALTLSPGETVRAAGAALSVSKKSGDALTSELGWRRGVLIFDRASLADVAGEVNRYNQKKLIVADEAAGRVHIGGTFRINDIDAIANIARETFGLHVEDRKTEIVISR